MDWQQTIAAAFLGLGAVFSLLNWAAVVATWRTGTFHSAVPLVGGLCLCLGAGLLPSLRPYAWAVPFLDYGTVVFVLGLPGFVRELWATSRFNLVEEYVGVTGRTTVRVRLFRRGVCVVRWDIARPPGDHGLVGMGRLCTWEREADRLVIRDGEDAAVLVQLDDGRAGVRPAAWFEFCKDSADLSGDGLELLRRVLRARAPDVG
jgi:hypothetical protein